MHEWKSLNMDAIKYVTKMLKELKIYQLDGLVKQTKPETPKKEK